IAATFAALAIAGRAVFSQANDADGRGPAPTGEARIDESIRRALDDVEGQKTEDRGIVILGDAFPGAGKIRMVPGGKFRAAGIAADDAEPSAADSDAGPGLLVAADRRMVLRLRRAEQYLAD